MCGAEVHLGGLHARDRAQLCLRLSGVGRLRFAAPRQGELDTRGRLLRRHLRPTPTARTVCLAPREAASHARRFPPGPLARLTLLHPAALERLPRRRACRAAFSSRTRSRTRPALSATAPPLWSRGQARQCRAQILQARRYGPEPVGHAAQTHSVGFGPPNVISRVRPHPEDRVIAMVHPLPTARITQHLVVGAGVRVSHDPQTLRTVEPHDQPLYLLIWSGAFPDRAQPRRAGLAARSKRATST